MPLEAGLAGVAHEIALDPDLDTGFTGLAVERGWALAILTPGSDTRWRCR